MVVLTSFSQPTNGIRHRQNNTTVFVNDNNLGKGTLYIAESCLSWVSDSGNGFTIEYPHICLHAVSRDLSAFPQECLFLMLDTALDDETNNGEGENDGGNENNSDGQGTTELRLVPDDRGMLDAMFHAMNACQALHPDPEDSFSDEDFYEDADDESPMDEADSQMGRLRIENMGGRRYMSDRVLGTGEDMVGGRVGVEDISGHIVRCIREISGNITEDISENMAEDAEDTEEDTEEDMEEDKVEDRVEDTFVGRGVDRGEGRVEDTFVGRGVDRVEDTFVGRRVDRGEDRVEDTFVGRGVDILVGRVEYTLESTLADREGGREVGRALGRTSDMDRDDRSFSSGNTLHRGSSASFPAAHLFHMAPEEDSNFADAEN